jgi:nitrous oxidase accessory protein NosD
LKSAGAPASIAAMRSALLIAAFVYAGAAAAADIAAADPRALAAALARAGAGDRIVLAPGDYGDLTIGPRRRAGALTVMAADEAAPPRFRSIFIREADGVALRGLDVRFGASAAPLAERAIEVRRSAAIRLEGLRISSAGNGDMSDDANGVIIRDSRDVTVTGSRFHDLFRGVIAYDSDEVTIAANSFSRIASDGVAGRGALGMTVENNSFTDFMPVDPVRWHPDAVQLWSRDAKRANERIVIRGNVIRRGAGAPTQGVFLKSPEIAARDILVEGNRIEQSMGQGIFVENAVGVTIRNNRLVAVEPVLHPPAIEVRAPFDDAVVEDNEAPKFRLPAGVAARDNRTAR